MWTLFDIIIINIWSATFALKHFKTFYAAVLPATKICMGGCKLHVRIFSWPLALKFGFAIDWCLIICYDNEIRSQRAHAPLAVQLYNRWIADRSKKEHFCEFFKDSIAQPADPIVKEGMGKGDSAVSSQTTPFSSLLPMERHCKKCIAKNTRVSNTVPIPSLSFMHATNGHDACLTRIAEIIRSDHVLLRKSYYYIALVNCESWFVLVHLSSQSTYESCVLDFPRVICIVQKFIGVLWASAIHAVWRCQSPSLRLPCNMHHYINRQHVRIAQLWIRQWFHATFDEFSTSSSPNGCMCDTFASHGIAKKFNGRGKCAHRNHRAVRSSDELINLNAALCVKRKLSH